jgi:sulfate adenylyltransferase large subunit
MATQLTEQQLIDSDIEAYLRKHEEKELLRFVTVGSVDDGKSTLIGRLLYESHGVYEDQLASVKKASEHKGSAGGEIDFALITDGLRSEREQGITIDVAYRYFNTERRKFIIADTPGHVQYTRNMATGASTADVGIILIDARQGVLQQSRRHAYIASLLGIPNLLVAVNKMDLVDYSPERYEEIAEEFRGFVANLNFTNVTFIPVSALKGDNVVHNSDRTPWYQGKTILQHLETVPIEENLKSEDFYFPVQYVIRPNLDFRGFSGTIASGEIGVGEEIIVLPSGKSSRVKSIVTYDGELRSAFQDQAVTITLEDEIDISRGDVLVKPENPFHLTHRFTSHLVWMNEEGLKPGKAYWVKQASSLYQGSVSQIAYRVNMDDLSQEKPKP